MKKGPLSGFGILVTRPETQAGDIVAAIEAEGGEAIRFPVMDIQPEDPADIGRCLETLPPPDITIFISINAVTYGLPFAGGDGTAIAAIGPSTKAALEAAGRQVDMFSTDGYDSEHLLALPQLRDVKGENVRIIRGDAGRKLLADTLRDRGAKVDYLAVYRRVTRAYSPNLLAGLEHRWRDGQINCVIAMSVNSLEKLIEILPARCRELLDGTPVVTPSVRVLRTASDKIPNSPTIRADGPQTDDMVRALIACRQSGAG